MKNNQKGFGLIETLLIIITLTLVSGVGYYIYSVNNSKEKSAKASESTKIEEPTTAKLPADDRLEMNENELPFIFKYPKDWSKEKESFETTGETAFTLAISAPGTKINESESGYASVASGAEISLYKYSTKNSNKNINEIKNDKNSTHQFNTNLKDMKIDGIEALEYDWSYEGPPRHITVFIKDSFQYSVSIEKDIYDKSEFKKAYEDLIKSIKFK